MWCGVVWCGVGGGVVRLVSVVWGGVGGVGVVWVVWCGGEWGGVVRW